MQVRHKAFFSALRQNGLKSDPTYAGSSYYITQCMEKHLPRLLNLGVTAIICSHDLIANAAMIQCQQMGYRIPDDISIIGFDDLPICAYTAPPLTTVRQERIQLGKSGYYALESLMNGIAIGTLLLHASLIVRNSTGPAKVPLDANTPDLNSYQLLPFLTEQAFSIFCATAAAAAAFIFLAPAGIQPHSAYRKCTFSHLLPVHD